MSKYAVEITIEFDQKPNDKDVRNYLLNECSHAKNLRWDLQTPKGYILDAQLKDRGKNGR
jgi:hypothetical protein|tara:strand:- start:206 stop:385 length:180 start_codon:yes stop_codon:yes gene_type:complete